MATSLDALTDPVQTLPPVAVYVCSDVRSGSTLLGSLLAERTHSLCAGELHHFHQLFHGTYKRVGICTCGLPFAECGFWRAAIDALRARGVDPGSLKTKLERPEGMAAQLRYNLALLGPDRKRWWWPFALTASEERSAREVVHATLAIYDAAQSVAGGATIVDVSKWAEKAAVLRRYAPEVSFIFLFRGGVAATLSKAHRGELSVPAALTSWLIVNVKNLTHRQRTPKERRVTISYEALCDETDASLEALFGSLSLRPSAERRPRSDSSNDHGLEGSPTRHQRRDGLVVTHTQRSGIGFLGRTLLTLAVAPVDAVAQRVGRGR